MYIYIYIYIYKIYIYIYIYIKSKKTTLYFDRAFQIALKHLHFQLQIHLTL